MGRLKHQNNVFGNFQSLRFMKAAIVQLNNQNTISKLLGDQIQKHLKTGAVKVCKLKEEMFSRTRLHNAVEISRQIIAIAPFLRV